MSNLLAEQVTVVHVSLSEHVSHVPLVTAGQPASHPSVGTPLVSNLLVSHEDIAVHPLATAVVQVEQMPLVATQFAASQQVASSHAFPVHDTPLPLLVPAPAVQV